MLTNKEIKEVLGNNRGDFEKFTKYLKVSREVLYYQLKSSALKHNLDGQFREFLLTLKAKE